MYMLKFFYKIRQLYEVVIQTTIGGKVIARET